jgi:hypothetical protein
MHCPMGRKDLSQVYWGEASADLVLGLSLYFILWNRGQGGLEVKSGAVGHGPGGSSMAAHGDELNRFCHHCLVLH